MSTIDLFIDYVDQKLGDQLKPLEESMERQIENGYVIDDRNIFVFYKELEYFRSIYMREIPIYIVSDHFVKILLKENVKILDKKLEKFLSQKGSLYNNTDLYESTVSTLIYLKPYNEFTLEEVKLDNTVLYFRIDNFSPKLDKDPLSHKKIGSLRILNNEHYKSFLKNLENNIIDESAKIYMTTFSMLEYARDAFFTEKSGSIAKKKALSQRFSGLI